MEVTKRSREEKPRGMGADVREQIFFKANTQF